MTREEAIKWLKTFNGNTGISELSQAFDVAIQALQQEPCDDAISKQSVIELIEGLWVGHTKEDDLVKEIKSLQPVHTRQKTGRCKDCKHFEYDTVAKVDGMQLIFAHEICERWGDGYFYRAKLVNSDNQLYKQSGNGITINVVAAIGKLIA